MRAVLDTNIILYLLAERLVEPIPEGEYYASVVSYIEALSFPSLDEIAEAQIRALFQDLTIVETTTEIAGAAIRLRRRQTLKTPDAIIAATAYTLHCALMSNDRVFSRLTEISFIPVQVHRAPHRGRSIG